MISVIVPIYNAEKYLSRCLDSIISQTYKDIEILLINDGSSDQSYKVCQSYAQFDDRIRIWSINKTGVSFARNFGINQAIGEFVFFMDADDTLMSQSLEYLYDAYKYSKADMIIGNAIHLHKGFQLKKLWRENDHFFDRMAITQLFIDFLEDPKAHRLFWSVWGILYKADIIHQDGIYFDENLETYEDVLYVFSYLSKCQSFYYSAKYVYTYYYNQENIGSHLIVNNPLSFKKSLKFMGECLKTRNVKDVERYYGNAVVEYSILLIFQFVRMHHFRSIYLWKTIYAAVGEIVNDSDCQKNLLYYKQKHKDNFTIIPMLIKHKLVLWIIIVFKIQIILQKIGARK